MADEVIRVLVVDDHTVVREGLRALLDTESDIEVVGQARDGHEAVALAAKLNPDVILMDLVMPEMDGVEAIRRIRARDGEARILVLTSFGSDNKLFPAVKAGALGYLIKDTQPKQLLLAVREAAVGQSALDPTVARRLLREISSERETLAPSDQLSVREKEVLRCLAAGLSNERIGGKLFISEATVRTHVSHILTKLNLDNRTQAALYALRVGIATLDEPDTP
ncbi:response regulator transcription factor [bacterium]|nr:response regulator transcription factor [bacterium]